MFAFLYKILFEIINSAIQVISNGIWTVVLNLPHVDEVTRKIKQTGIIDWPAAVYLLKNYALGLLTALFMTHVPKKDGRIKVPFYYDIEVRSSSVPQVTLNH